jgi:hypothetical protein
MPKHQAPRSWAKARVTGSVSQVWMGGAVLAAAGMSGQRAFGLDGWPARPLLFVL